MGMGEVIPSNGDFFSLQKLLCPVDNTSALEQLLAQRRTCYTMRHPQLQGVLQFGTHVEGPRINWSCLPQT